MMVVLSKGNLAELLFDMLKDRAIEILSLDRMTTKPGTKLVSQSVGGAPWLQATDRGGTADQHIANLAQIIAEQAKKVRFGLLWLPPLSSKSVISVKMFEYQDVAVREIVTVRAVRLDALFCDGDAEIIKAA